MTKKEQSEPRESCRFRKATLSMAGSIGRRRRPTDIRHFGNLVFPCPSTLNGRRSGDVVVSGTTRDEEDPLRGSTDGERPRRRWAIDAGVEPRRQPGFQFKVGRACRDFNVQNAYAKLFAPLAVVVAAVVVVVVAVAPSVSSSSSQTPLTPWHSDRRTTTSVSMFPPGRKKISKSDASSSRKGAQVERRRPPVRHVTLAGRMLPCWKHFEVAATKGQITFFEAVPRQEALGDVSHRSV